MTDSELLQAATLTPSEIASATLGLSQLDYSSACRHIADAARDKALREAEAYWGEILMKYGRHLESCNCYYMDGRSGQKLARKCDCGFDAILAPEKGT